MGQYGGGKGIEVNGNYSSTWIQINAQLEEVNC